MINKLYFKRKIDQQEAFISWDAEENEIYIEMSHYEYIDTQSGYDGYKKLLNEAEKRYPDLVFYVSDEDGYTLSGKAINLVRNYLKLERL